MQGKSLKLKTIMILFFSMTIIFCHSISRASSNFQGLIDSTVDENDTVSVEVKEVKTNSAFATSVVAAYTPDNSEISYEPFTEDIVETQPVTNSTIIMSEADRRTLASAVGEFSIEKKALPGHKNPGRRR